MNKKLILIKCFMIMGILSIGLVQADVILNEEEVIDLRTPFVINVNTVATGFDGNATSICSGSQVLLGNGTCTTVSSLAGDTNETSRFAALTDSDCPSGQLVIGVQVNGTVLCATDDTGGATNIFDQSLNQTSNVTFNNITLDGIDVGTFLFNQSLVCPDNSILLNILNVTLEV